MMKGYLSVIVACLGLVCVTQGYPSGAPAQVCETMTPGHGSQPRDRTAPFEISWTKTSDSGADVSVRATSASTSMKGFILQAREEGPGGDILLPVGHFKLTDLTQTKLMSCDGGVNNSVTHSSRSDKERGVNVMWMPPMWWQGRVTFFVTVVEDTSTYWKLQSEQLTVDEERTPPVLADWTTPTPGPANRSTHVPTAAPWVTPSPAPGPWETPAPAPACMECDMMRCDDRGMCMEGCADRYYSTAISDGRCMLCSKLCADGSCDRLTGVCDWCMSGLSGLYCDEICSDDRGCCQGKECVIHTSGSPGVTASVTACFTLMAIAAVWNQL